jgi:hypothetical protein
MSLAAHALALPLASIQPTRAILQPQFPTYTPASFSSCLSGFEVHASPSELADNNSHSPAGASVTTVMSSECV